MGACFISQAPTKPSQNQDTVSGQFPTKPTQTQDTVSGQFLTKSSRAHGSTDPAQIRLPSGRKDRERLIVFAELSQEASRFDQMVNCMRQVAYTRVPLDKEERNLYFAAYKHKLDSCRLAWEVISSQEEALSDEDPRKKTIQNYAKELNKEFKNVCHEALETLNKTLIPMSEEVTEGQIFYLKMKGDLYRRLLEMTDNSKESKSLKRKAGEAYSLAMDIAEKTLIATDSTRLELALNVCKFYQETYENPEYACTLARKALDEANSEITQSDMLPYVETETLMRELAVNMVTWAEGNEDLEDFQSY